MDSTQTLSIDPSSSPTREVYANAVLGTNRKEAWAEMREKSKKVEPVRSVSGSLFVSVCGFIKRKQETRFKANNDMYNVEIMAYPEENKFVFEGERFNSLPSHIDFDGFSHFSKQITIPIAWSLQQVRFLFLLFSFFIF
jgi:hypothetical protein